MTSVQNDHLQKMIEWLNHTFSNIEFLKNLFLIGSALHKNQKETNDVDVVQQIQFENSSKLAEYTRIISLIRDDFAKEFSRSLHITTFTQNELKEFEEFMSKNQYIKLV